MAVWAISDLHLPAHQKPMDVFGPHWQNHFERIREDWLERVSGEDVVLLPGDLSWAMHLEEALEDLSRIGALPGRKILLRGNHDYWWSSIGRVRRALPEGCYAIQNDSRQRLEMSLSNARARSADAPLIAMMHYPPRTEAVEGFSDILRRYGAAVVVYGHLHGAGLASALRGEVDGIDYHQVSCDGLGFRLDCIRP